MASTRSDARAETEAMLAAAGIVVTDEGRERARRKLDEARRRWTPELDAQLRRQVGLPSRAA